ncbi:unnamed protein product, partial [Effrenium voratum]
QELYVWKEPPAWELFLAALATLAAAGILRILPRLLGVAGRKLERCLSAMPAARARCWRRTCRSFRRCMRCGRRPQAVSPEGSSEPPSPHRTPRRVKAKAKAQAKAPSVQPKLVGDSSEEEAPEPTLTQARMMQVRAKVQPAAIAVAAETVPTVAELPEVAEAAEAQ